MKTTRQGVFETNSSSTHSVTIAEDGELLDTLPVDEDGKVSLQTGEYGWEVEGYRHVSERAQYATTLAMGRIDSEKEKLMKMMVKVIKEHTGCKKVVVQTRYADDFGYIDHNSILEALKIFVTEKTLKNFLFNPRSYFETSNDNM